MSIEDRIAVVEAALAGKDIQVSDGDGCWLDTTTPVGDWSYNLDYRIKPEPQRIYRITMRGDKVAFVDSLNLNDVKELYGEAILEITPFIEEVG